MEYVILLGAYKLSVSLGTVILYTCVLFSCSDLRCFPCTCSAVGNDCKVDLKYAWDAVKRKLLDSLDAIEHRTNLGSGIVKCEEHPAKPLLNLYAISEGPKLKLLWASFHHLEEEAGTVFVVSCTIFAFNNLFSLQSGFFEHSLLFRRQFVGGLRFLKC